MRKYNEEKLAKLVTLDEIMEKNFTKEEIEEIEIKARYIILVSKIRELRKALGYSQEKLSELSGVPRPTLSKIESGRRNATLETLLKISKSLGKELVIDFV